MGIKLTWTNDNAQASGINIYRSEAPFGIDNLPPVHDTAAPDAVQYTDTSVEFDKVYCYRVGVVASDGDEVIGELKSFTSLPYTGPGPQEMLAGNAHAVGLFGVLNQEEFLFNNELALAAGFSGADNRIFNQNNQTQRWVKVVFKGKILFIPINGIVNDVSWEELYKLGLVYGDNTTGLAPVGDPVVQDARITVDTSTFKIRLPKGAVGDSVDTTDGNYVQAPNDESEWNELFYRLQMSTPTREGKVLSESVAGWAICQEHVTDSEGAVTNERLFREPNTSNTITHGHGNSGTRWVPILEYVPNE